MDKCILYTCYRYVIYYSMLAWQNLYRVSTKQYEAIRYGFTNTARTTHQSPDRACGVVRPSSADCYGRCHAVGAVSSRQRHVADRGSSACCLGDRTVAISPTTKCARISTNAHPTNILSMPSTKAEHQNHPNMLSSTTATTSAPLRCFSSMMVSSTGKRAARRLVRLERDGALLALAAV